MKHDDSIIGRDQSTVLSTRTGLAGAPVEESRLSMLVYHRDGSQMVPLLEGQQVVIGRARPADLPLRDRSLSRQHARIELTGGEIWVEDLGSTNGTLLNGKKVKRCRVKLRDELRLGAVTVVFHQLAAFEPSADGLDSHDHLLQKLEQELLRAQTFGRQVSLLLVRALDRKGGHLSRWCPRVLRLLRPVDSTALYDPSSVLILLLEAGSAEALTLAEAIVAGRQKGEPPLGCALASYPQNAVTAEELQASVLRGSRLASARKPVVVADAGEDEAAPVTDDDKVVVSPILREVFATARRVADSLVPVLIIGETGTGKEVLAREIHQASGRRSRPLRCLNCAAIPQQLVESALFGHERGAFTGADQRAKGLFEEAEGGTVLLDEIGELAPGAQAALLRVIETRRVSRVGSSKELEVDVRVLAATHRDLEAMCQEGSFRWDLFYRLNTVLLSLPPLRERPEDILPLAEHFMRAAVKANRCRVRRIDASARRLLTAYSWPGNVRELRNAIERAVLIAQEETVAVDDLPEKIRRAEAGESRPDAPIQPEATGSRSPTGALGSPELPELPDLKERLRQYEAELLVEALRANEWNQTRTAKALGMPLRTLVHKMGTLGIRKRQD